jgi:hypothetical protein
MIATYFVAIITIYQLSQRYARGLCHSQEISVPLAEVVEEGVVVNGQYSLFASQQQFQKLYWIEIG